MSEKCNSKIAKIIIGIVISVILVVIGLGIYNNTIKPKKYDEYINKGNEYLLQENYEESINNFEKAINLYDTSVEARIGLAQCYIKNNAEKSIVYLKEAQNIDMENEELILTIIEMLREVNIKVANEFVINFLATVGIDNVSDSFRVNIIESTDKSELNKHIDKATSLYDNSVEGSQEGQFKVGSKEELSNSIDAAKKISNNYLATQDEVNNEVSTIEDAIIDFERGKVKAMPDGIGNKYINRLMDIESEVNSAYDSLDLSNAEMGDIVWNALSKYESVMNDIYTDLNTYLPEDKKALLSSEKLKYQNERAQAQAEFNQALAESFGTWGVTGEPDALGTAVKKHCYYLINKYMQ